LLAGLEEVLTNKRSKEITEYTNSTSKRQWKNNDNRLKKCHVQNYSGGKRRITEPRAPTMQPYAMDVIKDTNANVDENAVF